jgi:hypothetical protein
MLSMILRQALFTLGSTVALAQSAPSDLSVVKFSGKIVSQAPYQLKFEAPKGHHFNQEAPAKVEMKNGEALIPGKIDKTLQAMTVAFAKDTKPSADCTVKASLYVCNDANTYCLPIKRDFECKNLQAKN